MSAERGAPVPASVALHRVRLPLVRSHRAAHGTEAIREVVLVEVVLDDGQVGWGECSTLSRPTYSPEYTTTAWWVLREVVVPAVLAGEPPAVAGHRMAVAAVATAMADAVLRQVGRSLAQEVAGRHGTSPRPAVPWAAVIGRGPDPDAVVAEAGEALAAGAVLVKCKATPRAEDLAAVEAVRAAFPDAALAVDWNGTAEPAGLRRLDRLGLAYVEQPAPADALVASAAMAASIGAPVALDESVATRGELDTAVALGAGRIVNVKPGRAGGPAAAADLVAHARNAGLEAFVGGMVETGVGRAAALAVAALPGCALPTDLGPSSRYLSPELTEELVVDDRGRMVVPAGPGIGVVPDPDRLAAATVDRWRAERSRP
jgi:O-succinylbenzoate synthase